MIHTKKISITFSILLFFTSCIIGNFDGLEKYKYNIETFRYIEEAMEEFFYQYPKTHITDEILTNLNNAFAYNYGNRPHIFNCEKNILFPDYIDEEFVKEFFGKMKKYDGLNAFGNQRQNGNYNIISNDLNIHRIQIGFYTQYGTPLIILSRVDFADNKYRDNYMNRKDYPSSRIKEAKKEFESEILPKIFECIEIVRQKHLLEKK